MEEKQQYTEIMTEIIKKQSVILGPEIAVLKARSVSGLVVENDGRVSEVGENPQATLQKLVDQYVELSGQIVKNALGSIFAKYPNLDLDNK
ncbi:MAG: hypothetical protein A2566_00660 [Candidatus Zambryskibacteria bacterium RIFOXYD1_FULL_40_13]|nr:MAG: hypothetical protein UT25_C0001G0116 [Parcubacteria group bacterium GW2011_GWC1_39_12]KKR19640.1 MAG: hypothetical protein UT49_C0001G0116 [Parcubacteria group bacterium GW2011_GWF1_39_37]KKR35795.1 MAG: hypothetical protein UT68_C0001G0118 [Parcubacteria group bacterium GW2011_GWC2_40_10]KKR52608.1 MAG: hypothetical protein UT89_C0001G0116 [Parcubacteria group bacterium GW2011_GWE1_40_20]KKR66060.1 MAG: hypothetical protein UU06_C0006G0011 [Parcubacteria group bacterium GW2011_GWB1_40_